MMQAIFIQTCASSSPLLTHYEDNNGHLRSAGRDIKKAIAESEYEDWFPFTVKNLNFKPYFIVERMVYEKQLYAVVTNSAINYFFLIIK